MLTLVRPYLYSMQNRWRHRSAHRSRDVILLVGAILIAVGLYRGMRWVLLQMSSIAAVGYVGPFQTLNLIFLPLSVLLLSSALALAFGSLFVADDNEVIRASPIRWWRFITGKVFLVMIGTAWMPIIFLCPLFLAYQHHYQAPFSSLVLALISVALFMVIPVAGSIIVSIFVMRFFPQQWYRWLGGVFFLGVLWLFYLIFEVAAGAFTSGDSMKELLKVIDTFGSYQNPILPSLWISTFLGSLFEAPFRPFYPALQLVVGVSSTLFFMGGVMCILCYPHAFSRSRQGRITGVYQESAIHVIAKLFERIFPRSQVCIMRRELLSFTRDLGQIAQLGVLVVLVAVYVLNLKIFSSLPRVIEGGDFWKYLFHLLTMGMAAFVVTALSTRLVFPSISLEGKQLWILQTAPFHLRHFLWGKFFLWFPIVGITAAVLFGLGSFVLEPNVVKALLNAALGIVLAYGVVGTALGLGGLFANFSWEYQSQVAAGIGSLVFMITSVTLVFVTLMPSFIVIFSGHRSQLITELWVLIGVMNLFLGTVMVRVAERAMVKRLHRAS